MRRNRNSLAPHGLAAIPLAILLALASSLLATPPAYSSGDTLSLQITNGSSFAYGVCPKFHAVLTLATALQANYFLGINIQLSDGQSFGASMSSQSADGLTYTFDTCQAADGNGNPFNPGSYTATASFTNPETKAQTTSNQVAFSVTKASSTVSCDFGNSSLFMSPGTSVMVRADINGQQATQNKQFSLTFSGPATKTYTLTTDSSGSMSVPAPSQYGVYNVTCAFLGDSLYNGSSASVGSITVSQKQKLGGAQLYTNPTTLVANQAIQMYVVFKAGSGGPTPNGSFSVRVGQYYTANIKLGADGSALIKLNPIPNLGGATQILVWYAGDPYYNIQSFTFPMTNPPIPGGGGGGGGGGSSATPTATGAAATGTATAGDSATPVASPTAAPAPAKADPSGNNTVLWLVGIFGLLVVLGGGAGGVVYILRRRQASRIPV